VRRAAWRSLAWAVLAELGGSARGEGRGDREVTGALSAERISATRVMRFMGKKF
jgi:hypothetical protein